MGVALQGTVSKLPESINMNNECLLTLLILSVHFVPAPIVLARAEEQFNFAAGTRSNFFYRYEVSPKVFKGATCPRKSLTPHTQKKRSALPCTTTAKCGSNSRGEGMQSTNSRNTDGITYPTNINLPTASPLAGGLTHNIQSTGTNQ